MPDAHHESPAPLDPVAGDDPPPEPDYEALRGGMQQIARESAAAPLPDQYSTQPPLGERTLAARHAASQRNYLRWFYRRRRSLPASADRLVNEVDQREREAGAVEDRLAAFDAKLDALDGGAAHDPAQRFGETARSLLLIALATVVVADYFLLRPVVDEFFAESEQARRLGSFFLVALLGGLAAATGWGLKEALYTRAVARVRRAYQALTVMCAVALVVLSIGLVVLRGAQFVEATRAARTAEQTEQLETIDPRGGRQETAAGSSTQQEPLPGGLGVLLFAGVQAAFAALGVVIGFQERSPEAAERRGLLRRISDLELDFEDSAEHAREIREELDGVERAREQLADELFEAQQELRHRFEELCVEHRRVLVGALAHDPVRAAAVEALPYPTLEIPLLPTDQEISFLDDELDIDLT